MWGCTQRSKPQHSREESPGYLAAYTILVGLLHVVLLSTPFFSIPVVWTLTNVIHNLAMYIFLHTVKRTPFEPLAEEGLGYRHTGNRRTMDSNL